MLRGGMLKDGGFYILISSSGMRLLSTSSQSYFAELGVSSVDWSSFCEVMYEIATRQHDEMWGTLDLQGSRPMPSIIAAKHDIG